MKKIIILVIGAIVISLFLIVRYGSTEKTSPVPANETAVKVNNNKAGDTKEDVVTEDKAGGYQEYNDKVLETYKQKRRVLFFYANWCPTCRPADADFKANAKKLPEDVVLIRVNYNDSETDQDEKELATKYAVTYQHTFVQIDTNGHELAKWNGGQIQELLSNLRN